MKRLTPESIESYRQEIAKGREIKPERQAVFQCPLGEWIDTLQGFAWAYRLKHGINPKVHSIDKFDRFNAQGLEGKISIEVDLTTAIVMASQVEINRWAIYLKD